MSKKRSSVLTVEKDSQVQVTIRSIESVFTKRLTLLNADTRTVRPSTMTQATGTAMREKNMEQFINKA